MIKEKVDQLIEYVTHNHFSDEVYKAKKEYQEIAGEIFEDDKSYENRIAGFLEWYAFDRILPGKGNTPAELFVMENRDKLSPEQAEAYENFARNVHGIFAVKKIKENEVTILNLFDDEKYAIHENEGHVLFRKNDIFEGRVLPYGGKNYFTGIFCFHPAAALKFIKSEIKKFAENINQWKKELKKFNASWKNVDAKLNKTLEEIRKIKTKIHESGTISNVGKLEIKTIELESKKADLEKQKRDLEEKITEWETQKIKIQGRLARERLIQRLSYMNLKWERSRHIALNDIYRN